MVNFRLRALLAGTSLEMRTEFGFTSLLNLNSGEQTFLGAYSKVMDASTHTQTMYVNTYDYICSLYICTPYVWMIYVCICVCMYKDV